MGLLMRRRRPVMRLAGAAALGTAAYQSGKRHGAVLGRRPGASRAQQYAEPAPAPAPAPAAPAGDTTAELERLA